MSDEPFPTSVSPIVIIETSELKTAWIVCHIARKELQAEVLNDYAFLLPSVNSQEEVDEVERQLSKAFLFEEGDFTLTAYLGNLEFEMPSVASNRAD